jgi:hypothetical protein
MCVCVFVVFVLVADIPARYDKSGAAAQTALSPTQGDDVPPPAAPATRLPRLVGTPSPPPCRASGGVCVARWLLVRWASMSIEHAVPDSVCVVRVMWIGGCGVV